MHMEAESTNKKIRNPGYTVLRISLCVFIWFAASRLCTYGVTKVESAWPEWMRMILTTMVIPYGILLPILYRFIKRPGQQVTQRPQKMSAKQFISALVIQSGFSIFVMFGVNIVLMAFGVGTVSQISDQIAGHFLFYVILLLVFNPVMEEFLFRGVVLRSLRVLGEKQAILVSACLFALPHVISQGISQMFYTFVLGIVWGTVMIKTKRLRYVVLLHSLSNGYGTFLPMLLMKSRVGTVIYLAVWIVVMPAAAVILWWKRRKVSG